jgi:hypothetical protein
MAKTLSATGMHWNAELDGPFDARVTTSSDAVNQLLEENQSAKVQALASVMAAVESAVGKLTPHRRATLRESLIPVIADLAGNSWRQGSEAAKAARAFVQSGERNPDRNTVICEMLRKRLTRKKGRMTLDQAAEELSEMDKGGKPMFTDRNDGKNRMTASAIKQVWHRHKPK